MPIEFETKKLSMETLGEYLSSVRHQLNLTLEQVSQKTGVYEKFIHYMEAGNYQQLPPDVYVLGFLKKLAAVYEISQDDLLKQYKKERGIVEHIAKTEITSVNGWRAWFKKITITPKLLTVSSSVIVGLAAFLYIAYQVFAINNTPALTILEPKSDAVIKGTSVTITGKTEPGITVLINGQNIFVQKDGGFQTIIGVVPGQKELKIEAQNKFGKKKEQLLALRIEDDSHVAGAITTTPQIATEQLKVELQFAKKAKITVEHDGVKDAEEVVQANSTKSIEATDKIVITTSDAGSTKAVLNGKALGTLGKANQKITVPFTKNAGQLVSPEKTTPTAVPTSVNSAKIVQPSVTSTIKPTAKAAN